MPAGIGLVYCLPLVAGEQEVGIVQLRFAGCGPSPPTLYTPTLLSLAERAAPAVRQAWTDIRLRQLARSRLSVRPLEARRSHVAGSSGAELVEPFLDIRCLGAFELYRQGSHVPPESFHRRGALTLLKILLINDGRPVLRDALAELLWPEANPHAAANRLHVLVHTLRRVVEPSHRGRRWTFICTDGDRYYFNPDAPYRLDVKEFREYVGLGERLEREGNSAQAINAYEAAASLYRGDLMEEEPYAEWCWGERAHLKEICLTVHRRLGTFYLEQGGSEKSIEHYRRALRIDPLREEIHRGLMQAPWVANRRDEAIRQYRVCRETLRLDLGVDHMPDTERLYRDIQGKPAPG